MTEERRPAEVAEAHPALLEMLESLLAEVPEEAPPAPIVAPAAAPAVAPIEAPIEAPVKAPAVAPVAAPADPVTETLNIPQTAPLQRTRECVIYGADAGTKATPESRFSAIQFAVGRYRFVAPLNMLDSVVSIDRRPTPMFGQPDWHRGMVLNRGQQLVLVDLGQLLGLENVEPLTEPDHVLVLPGGRFGIISSMPPEPLSLSGSDIRWSRPEGWRPWLAAVLPKQMCVLVDVEAFLDELQA